MDRKAIVSYSSKFLTKNKTDACVAIAVFVFNP